MLLYYYDYYGCFIIINYYYDNNCSFLVCSYTGTNSCLTLCSSELMFSYECLNRQIICHLNFFIFCTALWKLLLKVKYELWLRPVWTQPLILLIPFVFFHYLPFSLFFFPCSRGKHATCVCCSERTLRFYSLSSFMVPICTILKVLILVYMQNIPVLQQKHVTKFKKKCYSITLIFSEHCTVALLCASI